MDHRRRTRSAVGPGEIARHGAAWRAPRTLVLLVGLGVPASSGVPGEIADHILGLKVLSRGPPASRPFPGSPQVDYD
ncbi:MAG TPA: hypothetical protein VME46_08040 [Acidimicrobiales bacterium]|nr:hypothetical protein [Acidimicrobiales bacterium]